MLFWLLLNVHRVQAHPMMLNHLAIAIVASYTSNEKLPCILRNLTRTPGLVCVTIALSPNM